MSKDKLRVLSVVGTLSAVPFLFGAQGRGCQPIAGADAGDAAGEDAAAEDAVTPPVEAGRGDACIDNVLCLLGDRWDPALCKCVSDVVDASATDTGPTVDGCVDTILCVVGDHWDPAACKCVPDVVDAGPSRDVACVDNVLCVAGDHWDPTSCRCVPNGNACAQASDCHGALPQICLASCPSDAGPKPGDCAHFECVRGTCETVICP